MQLSRKCLSFSLLAVSALSSINVFIQPLESSELTYFYYFYWLP